jgi:hypothetical protein
MIEARLRGLCMEIDDMSIINSESSYSPNVRRAGARNEIAESSGTG